MITVNLQLPLARTFAEQKCLARERTVSLLLGTKIHETKTKSNAAANQKESAYENRKHSFFACTINPELLGFQKGCALLFPALTRRKSNFFLAVDTTLLCAAKKNGVEKGTAWQITTRKALALVTTEGSWVKN